MFYSGIADEAGRDIETQIRAHQELGWKHIEFRNVGEDNLTNLPHDEFRRVADLVGAAGLQVSCFASRIANGSRKITHPFEVDVIELRRAVPRMKVMNTPYIRIMSYPNDDWDEDSWKKEVIRRIRKLARIAEDGGIILAHENCSGWAGRGPETTLELLEVVDSPALELVWDTGNPVYYGQNPVDFCRAVQDHVVHVHAKDYLRPAIPAFAGDGDGAVRETLSLLLSNGYNGGLSIEPHFDTNEPEIRYSNYVEYGRHFMRLMEGMMAGSPPYPDPSVARSDVSPEE